MNTTSLWAALTKERPSFPKLNKALEVDIVIIGGGITGITCALELIRTGKKVAVVEAKSVGGGTTGYSTGNLYIATQPYYTNIASKFDEKTAKLIAHSRKDAIDYIERMTKEHNIKCQFMRRPWYMYSIDEDHNSNIDDEVALLKKAGIDISFTDKLPVPVTFTKAAVMENQARFNPFMYTVGLAKTAAKEGCLIFEDSPVTEFTESDDDCCTIKTANGSIKADHLIMATHIPKGINTIQLYDAPYRSYVVAARLNGKVPNGNFWQVGGKTHHVTSSHSGDPSLMDLNLLMVAGSHHKVGQPSEEATDHYKHLENYARKHYDVASIEYKWSAQHYQPADHVPYIGRSPGKSDNSYIATGFFADGLVYGTIAGKVIPDLISGRETDLTKVYDPTRFNPLKSAKDTIVEGINEAIQYLKDVPWNVDAHKFSEVKPGQGKIMEIESEKYGVYRDDKNEIHIVSAVCTHMACIVEWNNAERSWDCPCHGSRFTHEGKVIEGPALVDLKKKSITK